jgi:hypothetical protein
MAEVVQLTKVFDRDLVDRALGQAAITTRFTIADLLSILATPPSTTITPSETHSLQPGTAAWRHIGNPINGFARPDRPHSTPDPAVDNGSQGDLGDGSARDQRR